MSDTWWKENHVRLYVSVMIDDKEVLKPANMQDVQTWLWDYARAYVVRQDTGNMLRSAAREIEDQDTVRIGLKKLEGQ